MKKTPLYDEHIKLQAKMVDFAGWQLPIQYEGVIAEHQTVRKHAGIFDVSHMGQVELKGAGSLEFAQHLTINDVRKLNDNQAQYSVLCREDGTAIDDIIVYRLNAEHFLFVINAANIEKDFTWIKQNCPQNVTASNRSDAYALIALQGPAAKDVLAKISNIPLGDMPPFHFATGSVAGIDNCIVATTGYTGEAGCEIFTPPNSAPQIWQALQNSGAKPIGLAARDTLRLEMGYCLYGHELSDEINPLEAGLAWVTKLNSAEDFIGKASLLNAKSAGLTKQIVGFKLKQRGIPREGYKVFANEQNIGFVTSGTMSPSLEQGIGLALINKEFSKVGSQFSIDIRGQQREAVAVKIPFYRRET